MWIERKFIRMLSSRLQCFHERSDGFNFRCPVCGDSKKSETKARGWLLEGDGTNPFRFYCFNCQASESFREFLRRVSPGMYEDYVTEKFREGKAANTARPVVAKMAPSFAPRPKPAVVTKPVDALLTLDEADWALEYVVSRKIPEIHHKHIFACDDVRRLAAAIPAYRDKKMSPNSCIVFPFYGADNSTAYLQCRMMGNGTFRYMTFELEGGEKIWGRHCIDMAAPIFLFEGPIDAMCVKNGAASGGADLIAAATELKSSADAKVVLCYDADWRSNKAIYSQVEKAIGLGHAVSLPKMPCKDVNECVMSGMSVDAVTDLMASAVSHGLSAKLKLSTVKRPWK